MVLNMLGEAEAAKYYIAMAIGNLVLIIPSSLGTSLFVEASHGQGLRAWLNKTPTTENSERRMAGPRANAATTKAQRRTKKGASFGS
jgi:O-antigen/teichoic acid export membrane protein